MLLMPDSAESDLLYLVSLGLVLRPGQGSARLVFQGEVCLVEIGVLRHSHKQWDRAYVPTIAKVLPWGMS